MTNRHHAKRKGGKAGQGNLVQFGALAVLLFLGGMTIVGPSGVLAWGETLATLEQRQDEIARLKAERDVLKNRVDLLDPKGVDPDIATELLRSNLNVVHPDEIVLVYD
jgi:cell division protein FtsB